MRSISEAVRPINNTNNNYNLDTDEESSLIKKLKRFPFSRLAFITIKDNANKWKIGKVNDWIKRYSSIYYIVKGTHGGDHYHLIAGMDQNINVRPSKGIHFHIKYLNDETKSVDIPDIEDRKDIDAMKRLAHIDNMTSIIKLQIPHQCVAISNMIMAYFRKVKRDSIRTKTSDMKSRKIVSVLDYLYQNLNEPRSSELYRRDKYLDYILKCPVKTNTSPRASHTPLGDGIRMLTIGQ